MIKAKRLNRSIHPGKEYTKKILQFGEGNFLRAFTNWMIHRMNQQADFDGGVVVVQPIDRGLVQILNDQDGLYTLYLNGIKNGKAVSEHDIIDCIQQSIDPYLDYQDYLSIADSQELKFVISNTTEAGISYYERDTLHSTPAKSFPAKLTTLLYRRFQTFKGDSTKGLIIMPCELIDRNGDNLLRIILQYTKEWNLGADFKSWLENDNIFCNTLVDRIVPGYPKSKIEVMEQELGYHDKLIVEGEQFHLWVIEGPASVKEELPADKSDINVIFTDDMEPYRTRKVRILNGAHTSMVPVAYLYGLETVRQAVEDNVVGRFVNDLIFEEICPTLDLPEDELRSYAVDVLDRFKNPFLVHELMSISLNSISKFNTRVLPSLLAYQKMNGKLPERIVLSFAALIVFYRGEASEVPISLNDSQEVLNLFRTEWAKFDGSGRALNKMVSNLLSHMEFWGQDLTLIPNLQEKIVEIITSILKNGIKSTLEMIEGHSKAS